MKYQQSLARSTPFVLLIICSLFLDLTYAIKAIDAEKSIERVNFDNPFNNTRNLGTPFLVEYDNTTGLKPLGIRTTDVGTEDFAITFSGIGIINHGNNTIAYNSNGSGIYITNPDGTVYQKGLIELKTEEANDTAIARYESKGSQAGEERVLDNGVMFFNSTSPNGKLSFLNNTVAVYEDVLGVGGSNITTIAWHWK